MRNLIGYKVFHICTFWSLSLSVMLCGCHRCPCESTRRSIHSSLSGKAATGPAEGPIRYAKGRTLATLANRHIYESSGLACSRRRDGIFWTHNDSGGGAEIFAFDNKGQDLGTFQIEGAAARDFEDMASFEIDGNSFLLIADVGDNAGKRSSCTLYVLAEPRIDPNSLPRRKLPVAMKLEFTYEDGPHDCEAVAVDPRGRKIYLLSKPLLPVCKVYELPLPEKQPKEMLTARAVGTVRIFLPTGMDISPDGRRAVICNYSEAFQYTRGAGETWADAFGRRKSMIMAFLAYMRSPRAPKN